MFICISLLSVSLYGQDTLQYADVGKMRFVDSVNAATLVVTAPRYSIPDDAIATMTFPKQPIFRKTVPAGWMESDVYQKVHLYNSSDSARTFYFLPAFYLNELKVFRLSESGKPEHIPRTE